MSLVSLGRLNGACRTKNSTYASSATEAGIICRKCDVYFTCGSTTGHALAYVERPPAEQPELRSLKRSGSSYAARYWQCCN
jgi:hypothetical protein